MRPFDASAQFWARQAHNATCRAPRATVKAMVAQVNTVHGNTIATGSQVKRKPFGVARSFKKLRGQQRQRLRWDQKSWQLKSSGDATGTASCDLLLCFSKQAESLRGQAASCRTHLWFELKALFVSSFVLIAPRPVREVLAHQGAYYRRSRSSCFRHC